MSRTACSVHPTPIDRSPQAVSDLRPLQHCEGVEDHAPGEPDHVAVAFNPISALTGGTLEELVSHPETNRLVRDLTGETEAVAAKLGIELPVSIEQRMAGAEKVGAHKSSMNVEGNACWPVELRSSRAELLSEKLRSTGVAVSFGPALRGATSPSEMSGVEVAQ